MHDADPADVRVIADIFHANLFMAQCGGIGVAELNKLELELCERLQWQLLPTVADIRELIDAMQNPQASFWDAWRNGPRSRLAVPNAAAAEAADEENAGQSGRLPHSKAVHHSLARFFGSSHNSEANLETTPSPGATEDASAKPLGNGSPRSVIGARTFSLSNLFGLASGW